MVVAGFNSGEIVALNSINGRVAWSDSLTSRATQITPLSELNAIVGRPVIDGDRVFAVSHGGRMVSIDMRTGERIWTADIGSIETPWVLGDFIFVVTLDGQVVCLSSAQGRVRWVSQLPAFEDPMIAKGVSIGRGRCWQAAKFMSHLRPAKCWRLIRPMAKSVSVWIWVSPSICRLWWQMARFTF